MADSALMGLKDPLKSSFSSFKWQASGKVINITGQAIEASLPNCELGTIARISIPGREDDVLAEVVGFKPHAVLLFPYNHLKGCAPGCKVAQINSYHQIPVGDGLLSRVVDPFLNPLDHKGDLFKMPTHLWASLDQAAPNPLERQRISRPMSLGVRAIDGLLTLGEGQRMGVMAGSGVGKSVLMGMIAKHTKADVNVIALIGERGREVREFIERDLGPEGLSRSVVVPVTSDQSPLLRIRGAKVATAIAEYFSRQGKSVLLMLDSLTRVAMAQREIGHAIGEPPTTKGYTPSVFSLLPSLLERTGPQKPGHGPISALYTVLVDGDDFNDPIADAARSILDGHINLSRDLASEGHFPAIDITTSSSRVMTDITSKEHQIIAQRIKALISIYSQNLDLVQFGTYRPGTNPLLDEALYLMPLIRRFLVQHMDESSDFSQTIADMISVLQSVQGQNQDA